jgi:hypothetical protein
MTKASKKGEEVSLSELARRAGLHRETVREKLASKGVKPQQEGARKKLYDADEALAALQGDERSGLRKAQTAKTTAEAARAKLKLDKERGELVPIQDVRADLHLIISEIRQHFLTRAQVLAPQLRGQKVTRIEAMLREDAESFFADLRAEHEGLLSEPQTED